MAQIDPCPKCGAPGVRTTNTRRYGERRVRRKCCGACGHRWSTAEVPLELEQEIASARQAIAAAAAALDGLAARLAPPEVPQHGG